MLDVQTVPALPLAGAHHERLSTTAEMERVLGAVAEEMRRAGYPDRDVFAVRLGLEEAVVNALKHGHGYDPSKVVRVEYDPNEDGYADTK